MVRTHVYALVGWSMFCPTQYISIRERGDARLYGDGYGNGYGDGTYSVGGTNFNSTVTYGYGQGYGNAYGGGNLFD